MQKMQKMQVQSLGWEDPLEKEMEYWKPTPVFLPGKSHGQRSLEGHSPWGHNRVRHNRECTHMGACTQTHTQICSLGIVTFGLDLPMVFCHCLFCCCLKVWGFPGDASGKESAWQCRRHEKLVRSLGWEDPLEKGTAIHSSILAWRIPWTEEPGRLQSIASQIVRHNWSDLAHTHAHLKVLLVLRRTVTAKSTDKGSISLFEPTS